MHEIIIRDYINKLTEEDIIKYGKKYDIDISIDDSRILYVYAKNYWREFYKEYPEDLINELKEKINPTTFNKLLEYYKRVKKNK